MKFYLQIYANYTQVLSPPRHKKFKHLTIVYKNKIRLESISIIINGHKNDINVDAEHYRFISKSGYPAPVPDYLRFIELPESEQLFPVFDYNFEFINNTKYSGIFELYLN